MTGGSYDQWRFGVHWSDPDDPLDDDVDRCDRCGSPEDLTTVSDGCLCKPCVDLLRERGDLDDEPGEDEDGEE